MKQTTMLQHFHLFTTPWPRLRTVHPSTYPGYTTSWVPSKNGAATWKKPNKSWSKALRCVSCLEIVAIEFD